MILTDDNIDKKTAKYWCFLSDKKLEDALKSVVKKANKSYKQEKSSKSVDESLTAGAIAAEVAWDVIAAGVSNYLDKTERAKWKDAEKIYQDNAYLDTLDMKHELSRLDDGEFYNLVKAAYVVRNYG